MGAKRGWILYTCTVFEVTAEAAVRFKVYLLRTSGRRMSWREVKNGPSFVGDLVTQALDVAGQRYRIATLRPADPLAAPPIPCLYEPVLVGFAPLAFRLRGFERVERPEGLIAVVQEWHCEGA